MSIEVRLIQNVKVRMPTMRPRSPLATPLSRISFGAKGEIKPKVAETTEYNESRM